MDGMVSQDDEHLRLLVIFHYIVGAVTALFGCLPLVHLMMGIMLVLHPEMMTPQGVGAGPAPPAMPAFFGWFFIVFASVFILAGWGLAAFLVYAGRCIARRQHHLLCLIVAGIACCFFPFGTALGVCTFVVLLRPPVQGMFLRAAGEVSP